MTQKKHKKSEDTSADARISEAEKKAGAAETSPDTDHDLSDQLETCLRSCEEYKDRYLRALADYKNLEHRIEQERNHIAQRTMRSVGERILPVLDMLDQAEIFTQDPGLTLVKDTLKKSVHDMGISEIPLEGTVFDPHLAEVVSVEAGDTSDVIVKVLQKGYRMADVVLRHGKVIVSKSSA